MCIYCGNIYKNHSSELANASDVLKAGVLGTNQDLANYLTSGFWHELEASPRKFNLTNTGTYAKNGVITYNTAGNEFDSDGISYERSLLVDESFKLLENILGIDFEKTNILDADIRFSDSYRGAFAYSDSSSGKINYSNINISNSWNGYLNGFGNYTFQSVLHEIGHALGLGHQGLYNGSGSYLTDTNFTNDSWQSSVMSYFHQEENTSIDASFAFLSTFSAADYIALDDLYNPEGFSLNNAFLGDTVYGFNTNISIFTSQIFNELSSWINSTAFTIADGNGNDTLDFSGFSNNQVIDLRSTEKDSISLFTSNIAGLTGNLIISAGTIIENAVGGSGNDTITGNFANNNLNGGYGNDLLIGGIGDDIYIIDSISDTVKENLNEGTDLIISSVSYTLPSSVEHITLTGSEDIDVSGNNLDNRLKGNSGENKIDGKSGEDTVIFDGLFNEYSLALSTGNLVIEDNRLSAPNGITTLENIEIAEFADSSKSINELFNIVYTIKDPNYASDDLNKLDSSTNIKINASAVTSLIGTAPSIAIAYASLGISGLGDENLTISDTSIDASLLNTLDKNTTGIVNASSIKTLTGFTSDINAAFSSEGISDSFNDFTLLKSSNQNTSGIINASSVENLTGSYSALNTTYASSRITGLANESITINSGTVSVSEVNNLGDLTTGIITATVSNTDIKTLKGITESGNALTITVMDSFIAAADLTVLDGKTTVAVRANSSNLIGTNKEKLAAYKAYNEGTITGLDNTFDASSYLASHSDLIKEFGSDTNKAKTHFFEFGVSEERSIGSFDVKSYLASNLDLLESFGSNTDSAFNHYFNHGYSENRSVNSFDELGYIASYSDLIIAFGTDKLAATNHFINYGFTENRSVTFNAKSYLARYSDLRDAFGTNEELAKLHFIEFGYIEGRNL